jgi:hypothetical protein
MTLSALSNEAMEASALLGHGEAANDDAHA